ncbi:MAG: hypothetical protein IKS18_03345 [Lachnospiraceae bacterium]|nr:hypothetical protein [Lachnospiraceae bacterium]
MRKGKLLGIILAALLGAGCIFAAVSPVVFAEGSEQEPEYRIVIPEEFPLCTELVFDGALVRIEVSDLEGEILKDYLADHLLITSEDGTEVLQEYYHIYDRREDAVPVVSLFEEDGVLTACVEDCASGLITLYKIGGFADDYCILETESVSLSDPVRVQEIRVLQYLVDGVPDEEPEETGSEEETDSEEDPGDEDLAEEEISTDGEDPESEGEETSEFTDDEIPESVDEVTSADDESEIVADPADGSDTEEDEDSEEDASLSDAESEDGESDEADSEETVSDDDSGASDDNAEEDAEVTSSDDASSVTEGPAESDSAETSEDDIPDSVE